MTCPLPALGRLHSLLLDNWPATPMPPPYSAHTSSLEFDWVIMASLHIYSLRASPVTPKMEATMGPGQCVTQKHIYMMNIWMTKWMNDPVSSKHPVRLCILQYKIWSIISNPMIKLTSEQWFTARWEWMSRWGTSREWVARCREGEADKILGTQHRKITPWPQLCPLSAEVVCRDWIKWSG